MKKETWIDIYVTMSRDEGDKGGKLMAVLRCPCGQDHALWGEFWWVGGEYRWVFFDDDVAGDTYAEQLENCPGCGAHLDRKNLKMTHPVRWEAR